MDPTARNAYLEAQVLTATPQRLRLMLIEGALRRARAAQDAWKAENWSDGLQAASQCRNILTELIGGIRPEKTDAARQVLAIYMFLFSTLVEAQMASDVARLADIIRVLEEERTTWQAVCEQMPERPTADAKLVEELAPTIIVTGDFDGYSSPEASASVSASAGFSIDA
jgi:flagellar secretion chaperone FliS